MVIVMPFWQLFLSILLLPNFLFMYLWFFFPRYYFIRLNHKYEDAASLFLYKLSRMDCSQRNFLYKIILCLFACVLQRWSYACFMHIFLKIGHAFDVNSILGLIFHVICIILDLCFLWEFIFDLINLGWKCLLFLL